MRGWQPSRRQCVGMQRGAPEPLDSNQQGCPSLLDQAGLHVGRRLQGKGATTTMRGCGAGKHLGERAHVAFAARGTLRQPGSQNTVRAIPTARCMSRSFRRHGVHEQINQKHGPRAGQHKHRCGRAPHLVAHQVEDGGCTRGGKGSCKATEGSQLPAPPTRSIWPCRRRACHPTAGQPKT